MNLITTTDSWKLFSLFNENYTIFFLCARELVVLDYSTDGDSTVEQVPCCSKVSLSVNYISSAVVWVHCQSESHVYARILNTTAALEYQYLNVFPLDLTLRLQILTSIGGYIYWLVKS